ncbi:LOW QUALITY PROTEIN: Pol protein [Phytophthora palmivora]|uniref:Pol protein n=1 Tax=Phytophthora palmivora TaxID=4796 RepID=A0A2P4YPB5_9STRA|nr:LOW QUALITY PROTEIN: Pol protein [Phytophthora palmivora]
MSEGEAFGPRLGSAAEPTCTSGLLEVDESRLRLPADDQGKTGILVFVCRLSKMVHLAPVRDKVTGKQAAQLFLDSVLRYHGLPETIVSDRDPRFTGARQADANQLEIALGLGPGGQAASQAGKPGALEVLRQDLDALGRSNKLKHRFIGPFAVLDRHGAAYAIDLPKSMATHPTFYVGRLSGTMIHRVLLLGRRKPKTSGQPELPVSKPLVFLRPRRKAQRIVIPLKTPHVERRVNGIRRAMSGQDRKGSDEALLQLVGLHRANHL